MHINCETHSFKAAVSAHSGGGYCESTHEAYLDAVKSRAGYDAAYMPVEYDTCECCGAKHEVGTNIMYNELMAMRLCEACWDSLVWN